MKPAVEGKPKALMTASVASMIDLFNMGNIEILQSLGYEIHVAANFRIGNITDRARVDEFKAELQERRIQVFDIPIPRNILALKKIAASVRMFQKIYRENQYRIVHCHSPIGGVLARLCARKAGKPAGAKMIYTAHGFHFYKGAPLLNWLVYYPIERYCSRFTDLLITINQEDFTFAKRRLYAVNTVYVQGVGVDLPRFQAETVSREALRDKLCIRHDAFTAITVGELSARKNQKTILKAIARTSTIHYILAGFGREEQKLRRLAERLGIAERVYFLGYRSDVSALYHCADVLCLSSFQEGLPLSLMEAMAAGLPALCSDIRGNRDLIVSRKGGFLYAPRDVSGFAKGLKELMDDAALRRDFGAFNAARVGGFSSEAVAERMRELYGAGVKKEKNELMTAGREC